MRSSLIMFVTIYHHWLSCLALRYFMFVALYHIGVVGFAMAGEGLGEHV